ncbi:unnamed protein product [Periconia digitata]|uniref:Zn(2)-C6 fungal-type domain-containing protein n=1 Tax=Periconia digitata TaxID=1303443 RepID=A0A9W4XKA1_9PLEO|nr:unnamed protein product [Periconia digitata]
MPAVPRRKCCIPCASAKRSCDKQVPECQRCIDRDIDCSYPLPKRSRRRRDIPFSESAVTEHVGSQPQDLPFIHPTTMGDSSSMNEGSYINTADLDFAYGWETVTQDQIELNVPLVDDMTFPYMPLTTIMSGTLPQPPSIPPLPQQLSATITTATQPPIFNSTNLTKPSCPWFLEEETWALKHCDETPSSSALLELDPFINSVKDMLKNWVQNGHNNFIHHRLYVKGMSTCLQDAFTTLASYMTAHTPTVKQTILQIAEERCARLVEQKGDIHNVDSATSGFYGGSVIQEGILTQLARVHALFVYEFIRLFDGEIRVRASAELQLSTLRKWTTSLRETIQQYRGDDTLVTPNPAGGNQQDQTHTQSDKDYSAATASWHLWILTESVRRSHLIIDAVANIYQTMTKGWAECAGAVMFTARAGLWDAETATKWCRLSGGGTSPLLVKSLSPGPIIASYKAGEVDSFARMYWTFIVGRERIEWWAERSGLEGIVG